MSSAASPNRTGLAAAQVRNDGKRQTIRILGSARILC